MIFTSTRRSRFKVSNLSISQTCRTAPKVRIYTATSYTTTTLHQSNLQPVASLSSPSSPQSPITYRPPSSLPKLSPPSHSRPSKAPQTHATPYILTLRSPPNPRHLDLHPAHLSPPAPRSRPVIAQRMLLRGKLLLDLQSRFDVGKISDFGMVKNICGTDFTLLC